MTGFLESLSNLQWGVVISLGATGIVMGLMSSLVGMRAKVENPAWWLLYSVWVVVVLKMNVLSPFLTILTASIIAGFVHSVTQSILIDSYIKNNPWYKEKMQGDTNKIRMMFVIMGLVVGVAFGAIVGGIAHWLS